MDRLVIKVQDVCKRYGSLDAVKRISFEVGASESFGLLGPNGAGKTTMMKMIYAKAERNRPDGGLVEVFGHDPAKDELHIKFLSGVVPQDNNLDEELDVEENLLVYSKFYDIPAKTARAKITELLEFLELTDKRKSSMKQLSGGMKRRLVIARALLNNPKLLILDEPTTGLDPQVRRLIWDKLRTLKAAGTTLLITTHYMEEAFNVCDTVMIMNRGEKIMQGAPRELLKKSIEEYVLEIGAREIPEEAGFDGKDPSIRVDLSMGSPRLYSCNLDKLRAIADRLNPDLCNLRHSNLEDVFLKATGSALNEFQ